MMVRSHYFTCTTDYFACLTKRKFRKNRICDKNEKTDYT